MDAVIGLPGHLLSIILMRSTLNSQYIYVRVVC